MEKPGLSVEFCGVSFPNPLILPSGIITEIPEHIEAAEGGAGGITTKSLTIEPREGYPQPRIIKFEHGYLNAVGLRNPGIVEGKKQVAELLKKVKVPLIVSFFAAGIKDFQKLVSAIAPLSPAFIEFNLSCPHVTNEFGKPLSMDKNGTAKVIRATKKIAKKIPIIAKLTPNVPDISEVAKACEQAGADGICAINTVGPGMVINIKTKKPLLGNRKGGVSGPAIKPIAIRCVYEIYEAVKIPIIGMGGITNGEDAIEMVMAGATLVGIGSAIYLRGKDVFDKICEEMQKFMKREGYQSIREMRGLAH